MTKEGASLGMPWGRHIVGTCRWQTGVGRRGVRRWSGFDQSRLGAASNVRKANEQHNPPMVAGVVFFALVVPSGRLPSRKGRRENEGR